MPTASPKAYTDEELKQQYGIHLATRMKTDDAGTKQANWADIDDDDDDWAPASMEWSDGTKITLPQADDPAPPAPEPVSSPAIKEPASAEIVKPQSPAPSQVAASPKVKASGLPSGRTSLILKGASEKPTLVAKPPGPPAPVKSPWAPLPPVDKATPITIDVPQPQLPPGRFAQRDPHGFQGMPPPPAKEIAADDFSRTWRENSNTSRELYDSKSGRYEPVNETRRGSRNEPRHPALLQRPSNQDGPAEPSAAFQTHRATGHDGYGRRRTSSNVSGGSGNFARRMSRGHDLPPPHDINTARRGSLAAVSDDPSSPRNFSPSGQYQAQKGPQNQTWQARPTPAVGQPSPQSAPENPAPVAESTPAQIPPAPSQDEIMEEQKKIMRQGRELAIKRRQEQEAKEEAERKERIRLKLEAMGPAPEKKKKDTPKIENAVPVQIQARKLSLTNEQPVADSPKDSKPSSSTPLDDQQDDRPNGTHSAASQLTQAATQESRSTQNWQNSSSSNERYQPWAPPLSQQQTRNVWGPPSNDRTLGNGTFNPDFNRLPDMQSTNPGPIGPPGRGNGNLQRGQREEYASRPAPIGPPNRQQTHQGFTRGQQDRPISAASPWANATEHIAAQDRQVRDTLDKDLQHRRDLESQGITTPEIVLKDTWKAVSLNDDGTRTKPKSSHTTIHGQEEATTRPIFEDRAATDEHDPLRRRQFDSVGSQPAQHDAWRSSSNISAPAPRSRFFPNRDIRLDEQNVPFDRPGSPSPPPPTMPGHPAYDGDIHHPLVHFPLPTPVVKLPPVFAPIGPPKPVSFAAAVTAPVLPQVPKRAEPSTISSEDWQTRINSLIGRKNMPIDAASKNALELPNAHYFATVSLPASQLGDEGAFATKPAAEQCFEEQEMGSRPTINVPKISPQNAWSLAPTPKVNPKKVFPHGHDGARNAPISVNTHIVTIKLPGLETKTVNLPPTSRQGSNPRNRNQRGGQRQNSASHPRGGRGRDAPSTSQSTNHDNSTPSISTRTGRGGRGGYGHGHGHGNGSWNRQASNPVHT